MARTEGSPEIATSALRAAVRDQDPSLALYDVQTSRAIMDQSVARPRFTTWLLSLFAFTGLILGVSGIYGVLSYTVARRTQEIGIRRALGAQPGRLVRDVITGGLVPVVVGLALGLLASYWTTALWRTLLFSVSPSDPLVYAGVTVGVLLVAVAATIVPAWRAIRVSPLVALRTE
ncbi:MAG: FtsX-like permease family protein [Acidobacteria bacterium]|nr:FtsX-like permease family protein [Acidobacteriota bacterium]